MMNFGRAVGLFNKFTPKITKGIGQVANIARNVGQAVKNVRNIGSTVNEISGGRIGNSRFGQKMQEITDKVESGSLSRERPNPRPGFLTNSILKGNVD
jgi:hypothetical protein